MKFGGLFYIIVKGCDYEIVRALEVIQRLCHESKTTIGFFVVNAMKFGQPDTKVDQCSMVSFTQNPIGHECLSITFHVGLHVVFSFLFSFFSFIEKLFWSMVRPSSSSVKCSEIVLNIFHQREIEMSMVTGP